MDLYYKVINNQYSETKQILKNEFNISSRLYLKLKNSNQIFLNKEPITHNTPVTLNDIIEINLDFVEDNSNIIPSKINFDILYEDKYLLVINKPSGFAIHPSILHFDNSISNGVKYYFDSIRFTKKNKNSK